MSMTLRPLLLTACAVLALQTSVAAAETGSAVVFGPAAADLDRVPAWDLSVAQGRCAASLSEAVERVRRQHNPQRVIDAQTRRNGNRESYQIKILTRDNKVRTVTVPGCSASSRD